MKTSRSIADVLENLEAQAIFHQERESFHASQETHHREQRSGQVLRRLRRLGRIHQVRRGRPHWEALYVREVPG